MPRQTTPGSTWFPLGRILYKRAQIWRSAAGKIWRARCGNGRFTVSNSGRRESGEIQGKTKISGKIPSLRIRRRHTLPLPISILSRAREIPMLRRSGCGHPGSRFRAQCRRDPLEIRMALIKTFPLSYFSRRAGTPRPLAAFPLKGGFLAARMENGRGSPSGRSRNGEFERSGALSGSRRRRSAQRRKPYRKHGGHRELPPAPPNGHSKQRGLPSEQRKRRFGPS